MPVIHAAIVHRGFNEALTLNRAKKAGELFLSFASSNYQDEYKELNKSTKNFSYASNVDNAYKKVPDLLSQAFTWLDILVAKASDEKSTINLHVEFNLFYSGENKSWLRRLIKWLDEKNYLQFISKITLDGTGGEPAAKLTEAEKKAGIEIMTPDEAKDEIEKIQGKLTPTTPTTSGRASRGGSRPRLGRKDSSRDSLSGTGDSGATTPRIANTPSPLNVDDSALPIETPTAVRPGEELRSPPSGLPPQHRRGGVVRRKGKGAPTPHAGAGAGAESNEFTSFGGGSLPHSHSLVDSVCGSMDSNNSDLNHASVEFGSVQLEQLPNLFRTVSLSASNSNLSDFVADNSDNNLSQGAAVLKALSVALTAAPTADAQVAPRNQHDLKVVIPQTPANATIGKATGDEEAVARVVGAGHDAGSPDSAITTPNTDSSRDSIASETDSSRSTDSVNTPAAVSPPADVASPEIIAGISTITLGR